MAERDAPQVDVSGLVPEARPIVERAAAVYVRRTAPWFVGLVVHGSAVKGGVIPNCSDVDFQLYLDDSAFDAEGGLPLELGFAIARDLEGIPLWPFRYLQCYAQRCTLPAGYVGPIPGAYRLLAGRLPVPEATAADLRLSAAQALIAIDPSPAFIMGNLLGPGGERLARNLRLLCTRVWPALFQVLTLLREEEDPVALWGLPKERAIHLLPQGTVLRAAAENFMGAVRAYYPTESSLEQALAMIRHGLGFMEEARRYGQEHRDQRECPCPAGGHDE